MNKAELVAAVAAKTNFTKKDAEVAINALLQSVQEALAKGEKVQLIGFGTFETRNRKAREGRNPRSQKRQSRLLLQRLLYSRQVRLLRML